MGCLCPEDLRREGREGLVCNGCRRWLIPVFLFRTVSETHSVVCSQAGHALELEGLSVEGSGVRAVVVTLIFWLWKSLGDKSASGMWLGPAAGSPGLRRALLGPCSPACLPVGLVGLWRLGLQGTLIGRWAWGLRSITPPRRAHSPLSLGSLLCIFVPDSGYPSLPSFLALCDCLCHPRHLCLFLSFCLFPFFCLFSPSPLSSSPSSSPRPPLPLPVRSLSSCYLIGC